MKNLLLFLFCCFHFCLSALAVATVQDKFNDLTELQKKVDERPSFDTVSEYLDRVLIEGEPVSVEPYLILLKDYVATPQQQAQFDYLTVRQNILENQLCEAQAGVHRLELYNQDYYLLALKALWRAREEGIADKQELKCFWKRTRSLMLSRGLLRSQSIYLDIKFQLDDSRLSKSSELQLKALTASLNSIDLSGFQLVVTGHADEQGSEQYNMSLSTRRAATVARYLNLHLQGQQQIVSHGMGESAPLVDKSGEQYYALNRRVEFHLTKREMKENE